MKTLLLCLLTTLAVAQTPQRPSATEGRPARPSIIFILVDDMAQADLGCYGNPYNLTPTIDKLAKDGVRFTQAYASCPVCSPSRASIMTGKSPARLRFTNFQGGERKDSASPILAAPWVKFLPGSETTVAERLKPLGYQTGFVGKWHLSGPGDATAPWGQGFDYARMIGKNSLDYYNYGIFEDSYQKEVIDSGRTYLTDKLTDYALDFDRGALYWHYPHFSNQTSRPAAATRQGDWKVVRSYETNRPELYNIKQDETEPVDLSKNTRRKRKN